MAEDEIEYNAGDIIYTEKEAGNAVFLIISGMVELYRQGTLVMDCRPGEYFGETEVMDNTVRMMAAVAKTKLLVKKMNKNDFMMLLKMDGDASVSVVKGISKKMLLLSRIDGKSVTSAPSSARGSLKKLSPSRSLIKKPDEASTAMEPPKKKPSFLSFLFKDAAEELPLNAPLIIIPAIEGDDEHNYQHLVADILRQLHGIRVRTYDQNMPTRDINKAFIIADSWLKDKHANLVLWLEREKNTSAIKIRFIPRDLNHDIPGIFNIYNVLKLPVNLNNEDKTLLKATVAGALPGLSYEQNKLLKLLIPQTLEGVSPPTDPDNLFCYANVLASAGNFDTKSTFYKQAEEAYRDYLRISVDKEKIYLSQAHYQLGLIWQTKGELLNDVDTLYKSAQAYDEAIQNVDRLHFPSEWALYYLKLGSVLYKIAQLEDDNEIYEQAMSAYKNALDVYNKSFEPMRCAEALNGLGLTMHVVAEHLKNKELAKNSVKLYSSSLEIRSREETPILWAATKNNMASAQFLLGRLTGEPEYYMNAVNGFREALDMYEKSSSYRMALVTTKNLKRAEEEFIKIGGVPGLAKSTQIPLPEIWDDDKD